MRQGNTDFKPSGYAHTNLISAMPQTICTTVYDFAELSLESQAVAINRLRDCNVKFNWWQLTYEQFIKTAAMLGISTDKDKINFTGFSLREVTVRFFGITPMS